MRRSAILASLTCMAFVWATLWPDIARARENAPPPAAAAAPAADDATMTAAKQHFTAGRTAYNASDFPTAIREFKAAEALRPSPILAYNIGLSNEKLGRKKVAVKYYQRYLESSPGASNRAEVEGRIAALSSQVAAQPQAQQVPDSSMDNPPPPMMDGSNQPPPVVAPGQDPYAAQPPLMTAPAHKKRRLWWVGLVVGLSVAVVVTVIVVAVVETRHNDTVYYYDAKVPALSNAHLLDRGVVPSQAHGAETAPLYQVHF